MCEKCAVIEKTIHKYGEFQRFISDQVTLERIKELIADLKAQIAALHPEPE